MINESITQRYKKIHLYKSDVEEYEVNYVNIGELSVIRGGKNISKQCKVILNLSKEALVGFGVYLIRLADGFMGHTISQIAPLGTGYGNQGMGFFLTPESCEFVIGRKNLQRLSDEMLLNVTRNHKEHDNNFKLEFLVDLNFDNDYLEYHNLGFENIAEIRVLMGKEDITKKCLVTLMLNEKGLVGFGTELLRLAHNYSLDSNYMQQPVSDNKADCTFGFFLTTESAPLVIGCKKYKDVFYYDKNFGR